MEPEHVCQPVAFSPWIGLDVAIDSHHLKTALEHPDAVQMALMLGRLDFASGLLGSVGIVLALGALFGFGFLNHRAKAVAKAETIVTVPEALRSAAGLEALKVALSDPLVLGRIQAYMDEAGLGDAEDSGRVDTDPDFRGGQDR